MAFRYATSRIDASSVERLPSGALRVNAVPTRTGVFEYTRADGSRVREYRSPEEVFKADSLASLEDVPVTIGHPPAGVRPENFRDRAVGHVRAGSVKVDASTGHVQAKLVLARKDAVEGVGKTVLELSSGYSCDVEPMPGVTPNGERYDAIQRNIRYDHVAGLRSGEGRLGAACSLRLDAADNQIYEGEPDEDMPPADPKAKKKTKADDMKITIDGKEYEGAEAQAKVLELQAARDGEKARADAAEVERAKRDAAAAVEARKGLESTAAKVLGSKFAFTRADDKGAVVPLTDREIQIAVIKRFDSAFTGKDANGADHPDVYVRARFDHSLATSTSAGAVIDGLNSHARGARTDSNEDPHKAERERLDALEKTNGQHWRGAPAAK